MDELTSDLLTGIGLLLTLIGAWIAARGVIIDDATAIKLGVGHWGGSTDQENIKLPRVQNLITSSKSARRGLALIALGTGLQLLPVVVRLWRPLTNWLN